MTTIPESTMREARAIAMDIHRSSINHTPTLIANALHAARQDQIRKDAEIARNYIGLGPRKGIATAIETQGGEK